ncbi:hypothetical protein [Ketogulonicigenium vulgare]|uniref:Uncharacterized protein n=1 Tax=Ketogulonicigenium vulgare (strain WSH-001) TaxID=759362 RepID=F9YA23_KETVW|nr:hypothetical protein [Ketogulonicigenium vulgare]ADO43136.1 hypothetical protein EIO_2027 [Ketogulonicigenium vulgare Y25]AEM41434.1 hypothetical protein KVU_1595 [Ketogulonicigenium vulgare WSH-001]ALJ82370.1 hypothetical protein KVH_10510 [Ketogulonicigenium vulgare]ANW35122.1 hypothetical protein KvSKV_10435 [Ketogulonicigenium vulgare]AOZ55173.1 hypothetical protein KVC_2166 [Ketogulonicigenium vulgare]
MSILYAHPDGLMSAQDLRETLVRDHIRASRVTLARPRGFFDISLHRDCEVDGAALADWALRRPANGPSAPAASLAS